MASTSTDFSQAKYSNKPNSSNLGRQSNFYISEVYYDSPLHNNYDNMMDS